MKLENTIIYLIGFSGTGKFSIAQEINKLTGTTIVDNHLINNPIFSLLPDGADFPPEGWLKIEQIRDAVFEAIAELAAPNASYIFTNELFERIYIDNGIFKKVADVAAARGSNFFPIRLICEESELLRRAVSEGRLERMKMTDTEAIKTKLAKYKLYTPKIAHETLDVTNLSAADAAITILSFLRKQES